MKTLVEKDYEILRSAHASNGAWRPWRGSYERAKKLTRDGLLAKAGITAMPPHVCYVITVRGEECLFGPRRR